MSLSTPDTAAGVDNRDHRPPLDPDVEELGVLEPPELANHEDAIQLFRHEIPEAIRFACQLLCPGGTVTRRELMREQAAGGVMADLMCWSRAAADVLESGHVTAWRGPTWPREKLLEAGAEYLQAVAVRGEASQDVAVETLHRLGGALSPEDRRHLEGVSPEERKREASLELEATLIRLVREGGEALLRELRGLSAGDVLALLRGEDPSPGELEATVTPLVRAIGGHPERDAILETLQRSKPAELLERLRQPASAEERAEASDEAMDEEDPEDALDSDESGDLPDAPGPRYAPRLVRPPILNDPDMIPEDVLRGWAAEALAVARDLIAANQEQTEPAFAEAAEAICEDVREGLVGAADSLERCPPRAWDRPSAEAWDLGAQVAGALPEGGRYDKTIQRLNLIRPIQRR